jgi:two-component system chemotaxis sensor kinase CheA
MDDMLHEFVAEALELVAEAEDNLLALSQQPGKIELVNAIFRAFHTIKGGAGFMNLPGIAATCHLTESLLDVLRAGQAAATPPVIDVALEANWFVADQLGALAKGAKPDQLLPMPEALSRRLSQAMLAPQQAQSEWVAEPDAPVSAPLRVVTEAALPAELDEAGWLAFYTALLPAPQAAQTVAPVPAMRVAAEPPPLARRALAVPARVSASADEEDATSETGATASQKEDSLRVKSSKLDALLEVAGESVQAANQASALLDKLLPFKQDPLAAQLMATLSETLARAARYSSELQRATLATRMQPVGRLFARFPRLVRELARDLGKSVELVIEGADTEVDRVVVDSLYEPLVHLLRNSLDHGVESAAQRLSQGKPATAKVSLRAWQEASHVVIEVADDGAGIDPQRLLNKALAMNLVSDAVALTKEEILQLMFLPGLSTKETASSVSGRGVGMDVVKTSVEKQRGTIRIDSDLGIGTCSAIRLPIELSIIPTLLVSVGEVLVGMPMSAVQRVIELPGQFLEVGGAPVFKDQGRPLAVRSLAATLGYQAAPERIGVVVVAAQPYILGACTVEGTADLVIKPMTALPARGIAGTARSAEGSLVLILDMAFLQGAGR